MSTLYTTATLFLGLSFDISEPVIKTEYRTNSITYRELRFFAGEGMQTEVAAMFVYPESKSGKVPAVLLLPDPDAKMEQEVLAYFALQGYAVMWFDLCGKKKEETEFYTRYPDFLSYANASEATFQLEDVRKTAWFEWIRLSRCALTATLSQPECNGQVAAVAMRRGGELLFPMLATDERLTAGVCMDYPGRSKAPDLTLTKTESVDALRTYYTCVSEDAYAALIEKPLLFLYGTNADHTPPLPDGKKIKYTAEEASEHLNYDWLKRADDVVDKCLKEYIYHYYAPRCGNFLDAAAERNLFLFLQYHLKKEYIVPPVKPVLTASDDFVFTLTEPLPEDALSATLYYALDEANYKKRELYSVPFRAVEGQLVATPSDIAGIHPLCAFACVKYRNGMTLSSGVLSFKGNHQGVHSLLIYDGIEQNTFFARPQAPLSGYGLITHHPVAFTENGPYELCGIGCSEGDLLATVRPGLSRFHPGQMLTLMMDAYSPIGQKLSLTLVTDTDSFSCSVELLGGELWQPIHLSACDFTDRNGQELTDFSDVSEIVFQTNSHALYTNILWT